MTDDIRRAGPGKFEGGTIVDSLLHVLSLDGVDDEIGEADTTGWFGLVTWESGEVVTLLNEVAEEEGEEPLNEAEVREYSPTVGAVIGENSQGFVSVKWYDDKETLRQEWDAVVEEIEKAFGPEDDNANVGESQEEDA